MTEITKAKKGSDEYLIDWCDYVIGELVREKKDLIKAYNYFNGVRDHYQYEHLEKNFGIGNPTSIGFTPLTRKHIEAIVGEYLTTEPKPRISCKDQRTLTNIHRDKQLEIAKKQKEWVSKYLENAVYAAIAGNQQQQNAITDSFIEQELKNIKDSVSRSFLSNYEIAAQDICQHVLHNREIDLKNKLEQMFLDMLIAGQVYYKIVPTHNRQNFKLEVHDPLNTWVDKDPKSRYMKNAYKSVVRKWMTVQEIEIKYGDYLTQKDLKELESWKGFYENTDPSNYALITGLKSRCGRAGTNPGILDGVGVHPLNDDPVEETWDLVPVYEVEWIDSKHDNGKWIGYCYHVTRIGQSIYVLDSDEIMMPRNADDPNIPRLSINGIWYTNGHGSPYSLMLATADLQDQYDLVYYLSNNALALGGTKGAIVDASSLPDFLGNTPEERLKKFMGYRKLGISLINTAQEGVANLNTIYNGFNDTVDPGTMQAYQLQLQQIEDTVSSITGVFRERLGGIEARDAVHNVEVGMQQSYIITKRYYQAMDTLLKEIFSDSIDMAKVVFKDGFTGQVVLGDQREIFTALPEYYTFTSYDIQLSDSAEIIKEQEMLKQLAQGYMQSNMMDPEILFIIYNSKSLTEMRELALKSIREKKLENNQIQQLQQQLQQAQQQQQELQKQLEASTKKIAQLNEKKLNIEQQNNQMDQELGYYKIEKDAELKNRELDIMEQKNKLEMAQLFDSNPNNDEVDHRRV